MTVARAVAPGLRTPRTMPRTATAAAYVRRSVAVRLSHAAVAGMIRSIAQRWCRLTATAIETAMPTGASRRTARNSRSTTESPSTTELTTHSRSTTGTAEADHASHRVWARASPVVRRSRTTSAAAPPRAPTTMAIRNHANSRSRPRSSAASARALSRAGFGRFASEGENGLLSRSPVRTVPTVPIAPAQTGHLQRDDRSRPSGKT